MPSPERPSWVPSAAGSGFGIENLPYGAVRVGGAAPELAVRVGAHALLLRPLADAGLLAAEALPVDAVHGATLNPLLAAGPDAWAALRARLQRLLAAEDRTIRDAPGLAERVLAPLADLAAVLPVAVGDYVDFYSSMQHAENVGRIFRPDGDPLLPNWRELPVGYHGRSGTVLVSGTPVVRPCGQRAPQGAGSRPSFGPERRLDIELELGFLTGDGPAGGGPIPVGEAERYVFGHVLLNDWSARELQRWEYQPLGPFLGKSFATSISPWVVPAAALAPYRVRGPAQDPAPLDYLQAEGDWALDVELEVGLAPAGGSGEAIVSRTNARGLYWGIAHQLAHATVNGATIRAGDLFGSGTISGSEPGSYGSLLELSWAGRDPLDVGDGQTRCFLEDGDTITLRGRCGGGGERPLVSFGEVSGRILPAGCANG